MAPQRPPLFRTYLKRHEASPRHPRTAQHPRALRSLIRRWCTQSLHLGGAHLGEQRLLHTMQLLDMLLLLSCCIYVAHNWGFAAFARESTSCMPLPNLTRLFCTCEVLVQRTSLSLVHITDAKQFSYMMKSTHSQVSIEALPAADGSGS